MLLRSQEEYPVQSSCYKNTVKLYFDVNVDLASLVNDIPVCSKLS